jgi:ubiquinone/menaquinone biosynthesis C-methylase UbiE
MNTEGQVQSIKQHYARADLGTEIFARLAATGHDLSALTYLDLAPFDQFHTRGRRATLELAQLAAVRPDLHVLDVGGGLGGSARTLAAEFGCHVTVLDLAEDYCRAGALLTQQTGLGDQVRFQQGNALAMPFTDASFDLVWTQHASMNITDKEQLYAEVDRVLKPHGRLALHEIMAGAVQPIHFPVPWAPDATISFLRPPEAMHALIQSAGFAELAWLDLSQTTLDWLKQQTAAAAGVAPPFGLDLLLGNQYAAISHNLIRNLNEDRMRIIQAVFVRI